MNFYHFHIGDYAKHTKHLEPMADLAYRRMLDMYYTTEQPLPLDPEKVAKSIGLKDSVLVVAEVLEDYFVKTKRGWMQTRCEREIKGYISRSKIARKNGKLGGRKKAENKENKPRANPGLTQGYVFANPEPSQRLAPSPSPSPSPSKEKDPKKDLQRKCVQKGKVLTSWPEDFVLTEDMAQYARDRGIGDPADEFENFRVKAISKSYKYADWKLAWYAWVRSPYQSKVMGGGFI